MILDTIANAEAYAALNLAITEGLNFIKQNAANLGEGKYNIDGDNLYVMVVNAELRPAKDAPLEAHRQYIDVQVVLSGEESYGWAPLVNCRHAKEEFNDQNDIIFFTDNPTTIVRATEGQFVVFFPEDCHAPLIGVGKVRKAVIKIKKQSKNSKITEVI